MEAPNGDACISSTSLLLELASSNDLEGFRHAVEEDSVSSKLDVVGSWYCRQNGTSQMRMEQRTPMMVASLYGSIDVLSYLLKLYASNGLDVNEKSQTDGSTALHCAAGGGSALVAKTVSLLLENGADLNAVDSQGRRPSDVIATFLRQSHLKAELERMLPAVKSSSSDHACVNGTEGSLSSEISRHSHTDYISCRLESLSVNEAPSKQLDSVVAKPSTEASEKPKDYPIDPTIPDIKNSMYTSDEFRMFSFKVRPCSRAYSHDWTECPFVHPGENARRRDPRRYHYSCVPCPDFRKGACRRGDVCEYAHGVFECWLHPAQYRTRLCKDGVGCTRRVCFFAHTNEELRPLYVSTGSALPSPRITSPLEMAPMPPASPPSVLMMSPFLSSNTIHHNGNIVTPPLSPSSPSAHSHPSAWSQSTNSVPTLHLPLVSSRLRAALCARDLSFDDLERVLEFDENYSGEYSSSLDFSSHPSPVISRLNAAGMTSPCGSSRANRYRNLGFSVVPTNLEDVLASEMISSRRDSYVETPIQHLHKSLHSQTHYQNEVQQAQMQLQLQLENQLQDTSLSCSSMMYPSSATSLSYVGGSQEGTDGSLRGTTHFPHFTHHRMGQSYSFQELGSVDSSSWPDWGSSSGEPEWTVQGGDISKLRNSVSFGAPENEERELVSNQDHIDIGMSDPKAESTSFYPRDGKAKNAESSAIYTKNGNTNAAESTSFYPKDGNANAEENTVFYPRDGDRGVQKDPSDHSVLGSWIDSMHLDQLVA